MRSMRLTVSLYFLLTSAGILAVAGSAAAEPLRAELFAGDVRSLAIHPQNPDMIFAGTTGGQVYRSEDGGRSWSDAGEILPFRGWVIGTLLFDPHQEDRLWAGLWGVWGSGRVAVSDDLGRTWSPRSNGLPDGPIYALAAVPGAPGRLYAASLSGVYGTDDGGRSWRHLTADHPEVHNVSSLLVDPNRPETVIAGTWRRAYRSDDGGRTWRGIFEGMALDSEVFSMHLVPDRPGAVWASTCGWVYHTSDLGEEWTRHKEGLDERRTPSFAVLPDGRLLAGTVQGLSASRDQGRSWRRLTPPSLTVRAIAHHPDRPGRIVLGTEGAGVWISEDGGGSFEKSSRGLTNARVGAVIVTGNEVLAAVNHAGPESGVYRSTDGGRTFTRELSDVPTVLGMAVRGPRVFAATEHGMWERVAGSWRNVAELGDRRVEQVVALDDRVVARTGDGLFELAPSERGGRFEAVAYHHGSPRWTALTSAALWVSDRQGLYRLTRETNDTLSAPFAGGRMLPFGQGMLYWGEQGLWQREEATGPWRQVLDEPVKGWPTDHPDLPLVVALGEEGFVLDGQTGQLLPLPVFFPARDVLSAAVVDGRLLLGTSGYGLVGITIPERAPAPVPASRP